MRRAVVAGAAGAGDDLAATEPKCANEIFNVTSGDFFRWQHLWPASTQCVRHAAGAASAALSSGLHGWQSVSLGHDHPTPRPEAGNRKSLVTSDSWTPGVG